MPVSIGSCTLLRFTMPGALISSRRVSVALIGPLPSIGSPSAFTTRPSSALPTGTEAICFVRRTVSPSRIVAELAHHRDADVVLLEVEDQALHPVLELHQLAGEHALQAVDAGDAVALAEHGSGLGDGDLLAVVLDLLAKDSADLVGTDVHGRRGLYHRARGARNARAGGVRPCWTPPPALFGARAGYLGRVRRTEKLYPTDTGLPW